MKPITKVILAMFIIVVLLVVMAGIDFYHKVTTPYKKYDDKITINVKKGAPVAAVARELHQKKIIQSYFYFRIYYRLFHSGASFKSGEYLFENPMTMKEVMAQLIQGRVLLHKITIKEGLIIREIAHVVERQRGIPAEDFIRAARNTDLIKDIDPTAPDLEGYLYPDTYFIRKDIDAREMVKLMVDKFKDNLSNSMRWRADQLGWSIRDVVTLASLIEKETAARDERFLISSVFHNRLKIGMPLGCDPTIIYALKRDNIYRGKLGWKELKYDSPYNTRKYRNLPPGPICSPGYASIEAALYPENTKYLYFVAKNSRSHYFSKTLREHNWAVRKFIINRK